MPPPQLLTFDLTKEEQNIVEAMLDGRKVQEYLWQDLSLLNRKYDADVWQRVFQKRVNKINQVTDITGAGKVELRKRILQQAILSVLALRVLDNEILNEAPVQNKIRVTVDLPQDHFNDDCEQILRAVVRDAFGGYANYDSNNVDISFIAINK